jgi:hypothetical protein
MFIIDWWQIFRAIAVKRYTYNTDLIEEILAINMILPKDHSYEVCRHIIDVGLFEFSRLKICIIIGVK